MTRYRDFHRRSIDDATRSGARGGADRLADAVRPVLDYVEAAVREMVRRRADTNLCHNAIDRHLADARRPGGAHLRLDRDRHETARTRYANCTPR